MKKTESLYWADQLADKIIREKGKKNLYIVESGITPSGTVHVGNFREEITVDIIKRALESKGCKAKHQHMWDDYDRFRKVPGNVPADWEDYLGMPDSEVPDPWDCHDSYAEHFEKEFQKPAEKLGIKPEYLYASRLYKKCTFKDEIKKALQKREIIKEILNKFKKEKTAEDFYPVEVYCEECGTDFTKVTSYDNDYTLTYECKCGFKGEVDFSKKGIVKLRWKTDWAMRWHYYDVDFEPAGKDHSTPGGSRDTSKLICEKVYGSLGPVYQMYDFVILKGIGGKMSGSKGNVISPAELLETYIPEVVRFLYAGTRPKAEFSIPLGDEEVFKVYEDFYNAERIYYEKQKLDDKKTIHWKRVYEMSVVDKPKKNMPVQAPFKYLVLLSQFYKNNENIIKKMIESKHINESQKNDPRLNQLIECARTWAKKRAPEDYVYDIEHKKEISLDQDEKAVLKKLLSRLDELTENDLYELSKNYGEKGAFFKLCYKVILGKEKGPKLFELINIAGKKKIRELIEKQF